MPESVWFSKMKPEAKEKHLKKVQTCQLEQGLESKTAAIEHAGVYQRQNTCLSVSVENAGLSSISLSTLTGMWKKAENLIQSEGHILKAPWLS